MISAVHVLEFDSLFSDAHCPISVTLEMRNTQTQCTNMHYRNCDPEIRLWDADKRDLFTQNLNLEEVQNIDSILNSLSLKNEVNLDEINTIVGLIENLFISNAELTFGYKRKVSETKQTQNKLRKPWFTSDCYRARESYHKIRKLYNKYKSSYYKNILKQVSKDYKNKMASNYRRYKSANISKLRNMRTSKPRDFWRIINSIDETKDKTAPLHNLYEYFKNINGGNIDDDTLENDQFIYMENPNMNESINQPFTEAEILSAIKTLKNNKSPGIDNILNEHLKSTAQIMSPIYVRLFNLLFDNSIVPENWSLGNILPIYKMKGDINAPENYRPITLLSCFGKLFTGILNSRITKYFEECETIDSCQAGFRKGFSTTDNLFILQSLIEIC